MANRPADGTASPHEVAEIEARWEAPLRADSYYAAVEAEIDRNRHARDDIARLLSSLRAVERERRVYLVQYTDYDTREIAAAFSTREAAEAYRLDVSSQGEQRGTWSVVEMTCDLPREQLPGAWLVRVGPTGELLCEPDWFAGDFGYRFGTPLSEGGYTTGEGWEGGAQAYGLTVEEARAKAWALVRALSPGATSTHG